MSMLECAYGRGNPSQDKVGLVGIPGRAGERRPASGVARGRGGTPRRGRGLDGWPVGDSARRDRPGEDLGPDLGLVNRRGGQHPFYRRHSDGRGCPGGSRVRTSNDEYGSPIFEVQVSDVGPVPLDESRSREPLSGEVPRDGRVHVHGSVEGCAPVLAGRQDPVGEGQAPPRSGEIQLVRPVVHHQADQHRMEDRQRVARRSMAELSRSRAARQPRAWAFLVRHGCMRKWGVVARFARVLPVRTPVRPRMGDRLRAALSIGSAPWPPSLPGPERLGRGVSPLSRTPRPPFSFKDDGRGVKTWVPRISFPRTGTGRHLSVALCPPHRAPARCYPPSGVVD